MRVAGTAQHQTPDRAPFAIYPVAYLAALRKDRRAFLGAAVPRRKFLSLWANHEVEALDFHSAERRADIKARLRLRKRHGRRGQDYHWHE
jgi:hypothetical protein